jgi:hypothetical protein
MQSPFGSGKTRKGSTPAPDFLQICEDGHMSRCPASPQSWDWGFRAERLLPNLKLPIGATSVKAAFASEPSSQH